MEDHVDKELDNQKEMEDRFFQKLYESGKVCRDHMTGMIRYQESWKSSTEALCAHQLHQYEDRTGAAEEAKRKVEADELEARKQLAKVTQQLALMKEAAPIPEGEQSLTTQSVMKKQLNAAERQNTAFRTKIEQMLEGENKHREEIRTLKERDRRTNLELSSTTRQLNSLKEQLEALRTDKGLEGKCPNKNMRSHSRTSKRPPGRGRHRSTIRLS